MAAKHEETDRPWTALEDDRLRAAWRAGACGPAHMPDLSVLLRRGRKAIQTRARVLKLDAPPERENPFTAKAPSASGVAKKGAGGKRADLDDRYFRSSWEANYARFLTWLAGKGEIASWEYEPETFVFPGITRGTTSYTPDFKVIAKSGAHAWHEVKGWMDPKSKTRLTRMAKFFPAEPIIVIDRQWFRANAILRGIVPGWETH